jgi:hypothetical protein
MKPDILQSPEGRRTLSRWLLAAAVVLAAVALVAMRSHAFDLPLEADEANYAYMGQRLLAGDRLYVDVWDHQPPGAFMLFAAVIATFGSDPIVFRWLAVGFSLVTLGFLVAILHRHCGRGAAASGAILFALASSDPATAGEGCNREIYMVAFILAAWWCVMRAGPRRTWGLLAAGLLLGIASVLKTIVAVHWLALAIWLVLQRRGQGDDLSRPRRIGLRILLFSLGPALIWLLTFAYFGATGRYDEFIDAVFRVNLSYSGSDEPFHLRFVRFFDPVGHRFPVYSALPLWIAGVGAVVVLLVMSVRRRTPAAASVLALLAAGYVAACLPGQFWPHYYYLLIPALVLAVSIAIWQVIAWIASILSLRGPTAIGANMLLYAIVPVLLLYSETRYYIAQPPFGITIHKYNSRDFWGRGIGEKVRQLTQPDDTIFVYSNDASLYYYSHRRCASRYTMITGLRQSYAGAAQRRATLIAELETAPPRLILVLADEEPFEAWKVFLRKYYDEPIGWDFNDCTGEPIMFILAARDRPVQPIDWNWHRKEVDGWCPS